jgi:hypothetical protein
MNRTLEFFAMNINIQETRQPRQRLPGDGTLQLMCSKPFIACSNSAERPRARMRGFPATSDGCYNCTCGGGAK